MTLPSTSSRPLNVLFICTGNSARSLFAEALLRDMGAGRFRAFSAGTHPADAPNPLTLQMLADKGHATGDLRSKSIDEFAAERAPVMDFVFTVCDQAANEDCPAWPGQPISAHWGQPDPVRVTGTQAERMLAFQAAYGGLRNRVASFVALHRASLQRRVDAIAQNEETA